MAFALPPFLSPKHYIPYPFCKIIVIVRKIILLCVRLLLWCCRLGVHLRLGVVVSVRCFSLRDLLHVFVSVSSSRCGVFFYAISYTCLSRCRGLNTVSSSMRSPTRLRLGCFLYGNLLHVFLVVFLWCLLVVSSIMAITYTSLPGCIPLRRSPIRLRLGVFRYGDLLHVFYDYLTKGDQLF